MVAVTYLPGAKEFIDEFSNIPVLIDEALIRLQNFTGIVGLEFEVFRDCSFTSLICRIKTTAGAEEAGSDLRIFDEKWWFENSIRSDGRLEFVIDFV